MSDVIEKFIKWVCVGMLITVAGFLGFILLIQFSRNYTEHQVVELLNKVNGGPVSNVELLLGSPSDIITDPEKMTAKLEYIGAVVPVNISEYSELSFFVHRGPPYRYVLIFSLPDSKNVDYSDWCGM
jgi:hypothetical protein